MPSPSSETALDYKELPHIEPVAVYDTKGSRLTCVTLGDGGAQAVQDEDVNNTGEKRRRQATEDSDVEEEEDEWPSQQEEEDEDEDEAEGEDEYEE